MSSCSAKDCARQAPSSSWTLRQARPIRRSMAASVSFPPPLSLRELRRRSLGFESARRGERREAPSPARPGTADHGWKLRAIPSRPVAVAGTRRPPTPRRSWPRRPLAALAAARRLRIVTVRPHSRSGRHEREGSWPAPARPSPVALHQHLDRAPRRRPLAARASRAVHVGLDDQSSAASARPSREFARAPLASTASEGVQREHWQHCRASPPSTDALCLLVRAAAPRSPPATSVVHLGDAAQRCARVAGRGASDAPGWGPSPPNEHRPHVPARLRRRRSGGRRETRFAVVPGRVVPGLEGTVGRCEPPA